MNKRLVVSDKTQRYSISYDLKQHIDKLRSEMINN